MFLVDDWFGLLTVSGLVLGTFGLGEALRHRARWASERTRKLAHIGVGAVIFFFPYLFKSVHPIGVLSSVFLLLLLSSKFLGFMQSIHAVKRSTLGVFYYPIAIYLTALLTWAHPPLFQICVLLLAFADGLAALVGKQYGRHRYHLGAHVRTLEGSATVIAVAWISTTSLLISSNTVRPGAAVLIGMLVAALTCAVEALSLWGMDNLLIPLVAAVYLLDAIQWPMAELTGHVGACLLSLAIATICQLKGYLKLNGAVAAWLVGYVTLGFGGWAFFVPLLAFFLAINWVGKLAERVAGHRLPSGFERVEEKGSRRDFVQVFANTGVGVALTIGYALARANSPVLARAFFCAYMGSLCAAAADTFASEVGILSKRQPVLLWTFKPVPTGLSGGVTWFGYAAAAVGALIPMGALALVGSPYALTGGFFGAVACGWIGSTLDSVVGATLQAKRECVVCSKILEKPSHCGLDTRHFSGWPRISNDVVNAVGALGGAIAGAWILGGGI